MNSHEISGPFFEEYSTLTEKNIPKLTKKQHDVLQLLAKGLTQGEIADELGKSHYTVRGHLYRNKPERKTLYARLGVRTDAAAIAAGYMYGLIDINDVSEGMNFGLYDELSPREREVFDTVTDTQAFGGSLNDVADNLGITRRTVIVHMNSVYEKLHIANINQAITYKVGRQLALNNEEEVL